MNVTFSRRSWHARLHDWAYATDAPKSLCPYTWRIVFAVVLLPLLLLGRLVGYVASGFRPDPDLPNFPLNIGAGIVAVVGLSFAALLMTMAVTKPIKFWVFVGGLLFGAVLCAVSVLIEGWWTGRDNRPGDKGQGLVSARIRAAKEKVCPIID